MQPIAELLSSKRIEQSQLFYGGGSQEKILLRPLEFVLLQPTYLNRVGSDRVVSGGRVGGGALTRWPPSATQTVRADFRHTAFTMTAQGAMSKRRNRSLIILAGSRRSLSRRCSLRMQAGHPEQRRTCWSRTGFVLLPSSSVTVISSRPRWIGARV